MNLDDIEIKNPKCFLITLTIGIAFEISRRQKMISAARAREEDRILQALAQRRRAWWR